MTEYSSRTGQHYSRAPPHANYNSQVYQNLENSYMPAQELYDPAESDSARVNNWNGHNGHNGHTSFSPVANHQANGQNGFSTNYGASMSEQHSTYHVNNQHRGGPNGISVNTTNLPLSNPNITNTINTNSGRIICVADVRGNLSLLNKLAEETGAIAVIHTGDFGFYEKESLSRITDRTLNHIIQYSTLISDEDRKNIPSDGLRRIIRESDDLFLSEFPYFRDGIRTLKVPVYAIWGVCEDVTVLEKLRMKAYNIPNLFILDEANTYLIDVGGIKLRLFGLGGAVVQHRLFDNGEGISTIAGGQGVMWTTMLQIGELVSTAQKVHNPTETRVLVTQASPGREGLLAQLSIVLKADFTISAGLHFRYCISYNEFSVQHDHDRFRKRLEESRKGFYELWAAVGDQVESNIDISQRPLLDNALEVVNRVPMPEREEAFFKNAWHFNLPDAAFGWLVLSIKEGRISSETKSQGFNFDYRKDVSSGLVPGIPSNPPLADAQNKRQTTQWQYSSPSPALPPQQANGVAVIQSLILAQQRSTSPVASSDVHSDWKQLRPHNGWMESSSPDEIEITSSSQKAGVEGQDMERTPSKVNGNDIGVNETVNVTSNNTINNNETTSINGSEQDDSNNIDSNQRIKSWADQTQIEDVGESSQSQINGENLNNEDDSSNNNSSAQQNRYSYNNNNNNNRRNNKFSPYSVRVENLTPPVSEEDIKEFFAPSGCQIERVKLPRDKESDEQLKYCYVEFQDGPSLDKAIQLNGQPFGPNQTSLNIRKSEFKWRGGRGRGRGYRRGGGHGNNGGKQNGGPQ